MFETVTIQNPTPYQVLTLSGHDATKAFTKRQANAIQATSP